MLLSTMHGDNTSRYTEVPLKKVAFNLPLQFGPSGLFLLNLSALFMGSIILWQRLVKLL